MLCDIYIQISKCISAVRYSRRFPDFSRNPVLGLVFGPGLVFGMHIPDAAVVSATRLCFVRHAASPRASQPIATKAIKAVAKSPSLDDRSRSPRVSPPRGFAMPRFVTFSPLLHEVSPRAVNPPLFLSLFCPFSFSLFLSSASLSAPISPSARLTFFDRRRRRRRRRRHHCCVGKTRAQEASASRDWKALSLFPTVTISVSVRFLLRSYCRPIQQSLFYISFSLITRH